MTKPTKWYVRPAKTQISLGIRAVSLLFYKRLSIFDVLHLYSIVKAQQNLPNDMCALLGCESLRRSGHIGVGGVRVWRVR